MLYREEQIRCPLYLIDYEQTLVPHEQARICLSSSPGWCLVEITQLGSREVRRREPRERALTSLPRSIENHDPRVS